MITRILLIAKRDYIGSVLTRAYLFSLLVLPVMLAASLFFAANSNKGSGKPQKVAIIDRSGFSATAVIQAAGEHNRHYIFEEIKPAPDESTSRSQLLALSDRIRKGDLFLVLVLPGSPPGPVLYYTNSTETQLNAWLNETVNDGLRRTRLGRLGLDRTDIANVMTGALLVSMNLAVRDKNTGRIEESRSVNRLQTFAVPFFLVMLLFLTVMTGASQKLGAIAEDKMQRVFEMLLVSASPFEMMMGKVLAALGISLTGCVVHLSVGVVALWYWASLSLVPVHLLPWFFAYLILDVVMLAALGAALGSTCGTPQDAQSLQFILFLPILIPILMLSSMMQQPNGTLATVMSFIPPFTPLVMMLRQALPGGVPWWQPWVGLAGTAACAVSITWAAARIFRVGILSQGRMPKFPELIQWVIHG